MTRGRRGSLGLRRRALPSPPPGRFIPAHALRSTPVTRASPLLRAGPPADAATVLSASGFRRTARSSRPQRLPAPGGSVGIRLPTFHAEAADRTRAASMPDTAWPVNGLPPGSSRTHLTDPVLMSAACFDTSSAVRSRSPSRSPPDAFCCAFSPRLTTMVFSQPSLRRFDITPRRCDAEGPDLIPCTAPHPGQIRHRHGLGTSGRHARRTGRRGTPDRMAFIGREEKLRRPWGRRAVHRQVSRSSHSRSEWCLHHRL
jgi:hypothetical protein